MLDAIIRGALRHRVAVLVVAGVLLVAGLLLTRRLPVDVFPDLSAPSVTVITEARGMAPEEVELLVTFPVESALNGAPGVRRLRSVSGAGIGVVWVEFEWGQDIYRARQVVAERLQGVALPGGVDRPALGPISSIMGEISFLALTSDRLSPMELRRVAETQVRRPLLALPGVSQVVPIGGDVREFLVELDPAAIAQAGISVEDVVAALEEASAVPAAGFHVDAGQEYLVRGLGRARSAEDLAATVLRVRDRVPLRIAQVANVREAPEPARGTAAYRARPAVVLSIQKQPGANTLELTAEIDHVLRDLQATLPAGVTIETENFRQSDFIEVAIRNVSLALRDGAVLVLIVLFLFLGNLRTTLISAVAIPLSLVAGVLVISALGGSLNTMTLGGFTIAIGALVDDAIIDVENVFRRLRENHRRPEAERRSTLDVVFRASSEVRNAILFATLVIALVFLPLLVLPGLEGRLLRPLGVAYLASLAGSLLVALTITPVLCYLLLRSEALLASHDPWLLRLAKRSYAPTLAFCLGHRKLVLGGATLAVVAALSAVPLLGRSFLPPFNEGSLTVGLVSPPGTPLADGDALGLQVEKALLAFPEVVSTSRRTGRAEKDEHVQGVNASEMEVVLRPGRPKEELLAEMRRAVATIPGVSASFGQPISHRIDHMISGSKTNLAVKLFGPDLSVLRELSASAERILRDVPGLVDLSNQEQATVPQLLVDFDREAMARYGLRPQDVGQSLEALFQGTAAGEVVEGGLTSRVVVRFPERLRADRDEMAALPVTTAEGALLRLGDVAHARFDLGPGLVRRENVQRVAMLTANVASSDLTGTVQAARQAIADGLALPEGYRVVFGGQFEEAARSQENLGLLAVAILAAMYGLLFFAFRSHRHTAIVLVNLPLALIGGVLALAVTGGGLNVASTVGFITLFGIAIRNGVLLVSHYEHLMRDEGMTLQEAVVRGSSERLAAVLMTALTAGLALIPLILAGHEAGNEIQSPMAIVILGGLLTSTFLNLVVVPVLFAGWGQEVATARELA
ncbi:MAG: efflux RND transporter permease subunit [Vicinamibacteria bacterium]|nr:efflux RND transporter permease subunit [Vicinamibacteria bacterium]